MIEGFIFPHPVTGGWVDKKKGGMPNQKENRSLTAVRL
jgi:hypothetical protein